MDAKLQSIVDRIERLEDEKKAIADDIKDVYQEAKSQGYDVKALRAIIRMRKQDADERAEQEAVIETYMSALGMLAGTPLGDAAINKAASSAKDGMKAAVAKSKATVRPRMEATAELAQAAADEGLISQEAARETARMAEAVACKFGDPLADVSAAIIAAADSDLDIPDYLRRN